MRSLLMTAGVLAGALMLGAAGVTASAQEQPSSSSPVPTLQHGVESVLLPGDVQRTMVSDRLEWARSRRSQLQTGDAGGSGSRGSGDGTQSPEVRAAIKALDTEIVALERRLANRSFSDVRITMPYTRVGDDGIAWSSMTYEMVPPTNPQDTHEGVTEKDPTQIVMWGAATRANVDSAFRNFTRPTDAYRWEDDDGGLCVASPQYIAMRNSSEGSGGWVWAKSDGLQPVEDQCVADPRQHMRFFSSSDNNMAGPALGPDTHYYRDWTVIAAHTDGWNVDLLEPLRGHYLASWQEGEDRVLASLTLPGDAPGESGLSWVRRIQDHDFGNAGTYQGHSYNGQGHLVEISRPLASTAPEPGAPAHVEAKRISSGSVVLSWGAGSHARWYDYQYVYTDGSVLLGGWTTVRDHTTTWARIPVDPAQGVRLRVRAHNATGVSAWSGTASSRTPAQLCASGAVLTGHTDDTDPATKTVFDDCAVLLAAKEVLAGDAPLNWSSSTSIGNWSGVALTGTPPRVTSLSLTYDGLNGSVPSELANLDRLQWLHLNDNDLTGAIPAALGSLSELRLLYLDANELTGGIPAALGQLARLEYLALDDNDLGGAIPPELGNLQRVRYLSLKNAGLSGEIPSTLAALPLLRNLNLRLAGNSLSGCIPHELQDLRAGDLGSLGLFYCPPVVSIEAPDGTAPTEGDMLTFTLSRTGSTRAALAVTVAVSESGAMLLAPTPTTVVFAANEAEATLTVNTEGDSLAESSSTVTVTVVDEGHYDVDPLASAAVLAVRDDDANPLTDASLSSLTIGIALTPSFLPDVTQYAASAAGSVSRVTVTAVPNNSGASVSITPADADTTTADMHEVDLQAQGTTTIEVTVTARDAATMRTYQVTVTRGSVVTIARSTETAETVSEGMSLSFTLTRTGDTTAELDVAVTLSTDPADADVYQGAASRTATFAPNSATATLTVATVDDTVDEANADVTATVATGTGYVVGTPDSATVTVEDDDDPPPEKDARLDSLSLSGVTLAPAFDAEVTSYTSEVAHSVAQTTVTATAKQSGASVSIAPADADTTATDHQVDLAAGAATSIVVTVESSDGTVEKVYSIAVTRAAAPEVTIALSDPAITQVIEGTSLGFTLTRGGDTAAELVVTVTLSTNPAGASVYQGAASRTSTFAPGSATATLTIATVNDTVDEANAVVTATVATGTGYTPGTPASASVTVLDNDGVLTCTQVVEADPPAGADSLGGDGTYTCTDTPPTVSQTANACYTFDGWTYSTSGTVRTATANYTVKRLSQEVVANPAAGADSLSGAGSYDCPDGPPEVSQTTNACYTFDGWTYTTSGSVRTATANYTVKRFTQKVVANPPAGADSLSGAGSYDCDQSPPTVSQTTNACYTFDGWTYETSGTMRTATANYTIKRYTLTPRGIPSSGGTIAFDPSGGTYDCGTEVTATATAAVCYDVRGDSSRDFLMDRDRSALFVFDKITYTLTTTVTPAYADIDVTPSGPYYCGDGTSVEVELDLWYPSYYVDSWNISGCSGTSCTVSMVGDRTVSATLAEDCDPNLGCTRSTSEGGEQAEPHTLSLTVNGAGAVDATGPPEPPKPGAAFDVTLTASWNDATHEFSGWGGDCSGTSPTCVVTMDGDRSVTADITELPADRCAEPGDADCIRAVYRGAPGDYAQVSDIPASALLTPGEGGRYDVRGGQQVTVVTAAPLPDGHARFHLRRNPAAAPSPVSEERPVLPVGTTYTFTPAADAADGTVITFELTAGSAPAEGEEAVLGDVVVRSTFRVVASSAPE